MALLLLHNYMDSIRMFRKRNVVYLFVLLALTMTLTGCFGSKEQSIDDFLKEISKAYKNLAIKPPN